MELTSEYCQFSAMASRPTAGAEEKAVEELFMDFYRERRGGVEPDESEQSLLCFAGEQVRHMDGNQNRETERQITELLKFAREQGNEV